MRHISMARGETEQKIGGQHFDGWNTKQRGSESSIVRMWAAHSNEESNEQSKRK